ncbi:MAG TPA: outer membrane protein assembly factor BamB [Gammaproteobacteria bacterium]|nr:outer membrane protein assembly factor BamB [Gammaproteobacteria bacterium]
MIRRLATLLVLASLLSACSWFGDKDNAEPPAKLEPFKEQVRLHSLWSRDTGEGTNGKLVKLVPAVVGERVYAADRSGVVWAFELESGRKIWRSRTGIAISAAVGVGEGLVLVGSSEADVVALDADSGEQRWHTQVSSEILSVPQIYEGVVVVQTVDGNVTGLDADNGTRLWIYDGSAPVLTLRGTSTPLVEQGAVMAGFANGKIIALDAASGRQLWEAQVAVPHGRSELQRMVDIDANAVLRDGILYVVSYQGRLAAIDLQSGQLVWNRDMSAYAGIAVDESQVYVSDADSVVWALDRATGASLWRQSKLRRRMLTGPAVVSAYVAVGDFEGYLHLLSRFDGSIVGRRKVDSDGIQAVPVALGDRLLVLGAGGELVLYELQAADDAS